ncbi:hypothetical protein HK405_005024, partial [Cladochytrium tenue]
VELTPVDQHAAISGLLDTAAARETSPLCPSGPSALLLPSAGGDGDAADPTFVRDVLVSTLFSDTYDPNRTAALHLLEDVFATPPTGSTPAAVPENYRWTAIGLTELLQNGVALLSRVRTNDAESGAYLIALVFRIGVLSNGWPLRLDNPSPSAPARSDRAPVDFYLSLLDLADANVRAAEAAGIEATAASRPIHGSLVALR